MNRFFDHNKTGTEWIKAKSTTRVLAKQTFFQKKPQEHAMFKILIQFFPLRQSKSD